MYELTLIFDLVVGFVLLFYALITSTLTDLEDQTYGMFDYYCNQKELSDAYVTGMWQVSLPDNSYLVTKCDTEIEYFDPVQNVCISYCPTG